MARCWERILLNKSSDMKPAHRTRALTTLAVATLGGLAPITASAALAPGETNVSTTLFIDASDISRSGVHADDEGLGMGLDRFYIDVKHRFDSRWSARVTTDVQWQRQQDPTDLWFKYAYLEGKFSNALMLRFGAAPMPWPAFANKWGGYRYVEKELVTREKVGGSSDWGVHAIGQVADNGSVEYAVSAVTGAGYKRPSAGDNIDVDARVAWQPSEHTVLGVGTYRGTLAQDAGTAPRLHTAERWTALAAYSDDRFRIGTQFFRADNWDQVNEVQPDAARGWSGWASWQLTPEMSVFARHDETRPSLRIDPSRDERLDLVGVEWTPDKRLRLALVGKRDALRSSTVNHHSNEVGVWAQLKF